MTLFGKWSPKISIHAPRAGSDVFTEIVSHGRNSFQSTLPVRGATQSTQNPRSEQQFQSTLPVRGATRPQILNAAWMDISIHAPRAGSDGNGARAG